MNVIFLDFNGVLDTYNETDIIDRDNLEILKNFVNLTNSKIVISSSIRNTYYYFGKHNDVMLYLLNTLRENGIEVIGYIPLMNNREEEIKTYLDEHKDIDNYYIIDDDYYFKSMKKHMIKLKPQYKGGNGLKEYNFVKRRYR